MQIQEVMTPNPVSCTPDTQVEEAARLMKAHDCGALPIVESAGSRKPVGVITDRDIVIRLLAEGRSARDTTVSEAMTPVAVTVHPDTDVAEAARRMRDEQLRRLVVVDAGGACVGLVSLGDVATTTAPEDAGAVLKDLSQPAPAR